MFSYLIYCFNKLFRLVQQLHQIGVELNLFELLFDIVQWMIERKNVNVKDFTSFTELFLKNLFSNILGSELLILATNLDKYLSDDEWICFVNVVLIMIHIIFVDAVDD